MRADGDMIAGADRDFVGEWDKVADKKSRYGWTISASFIFCGARWEFLRI